MFYSDDKELSSKADVISWNTLHNKDVENCKLGSPLMTRGDIPFILPRHRTPPNSILIW